MNLSAARCTDFRHSLIMCQYIGYSNQSRISDIFHFVPFLQTIRRNKTNKVEWLGTEKKLRSLNYTIHGDNTLPPLVWEAVGVRSPSGRCEAWRTASRTHHTGDPQISHARRVSAAATLCCITATHPNTVSKHQSKGNAALPTILYTRWK